LLDSLLQEIERSVEVRQYDLDHPHDPYKWGRG